MNQQPDPGWADRHLHPGEVSLVVLVAVLYFLLGQAI